MDIIKYDVYRGPNIGVYLSVNDTIGLVPMGFAETKADKLAEYLNIEIMYTAIANTRLIGALSVMNNKGFLLPSTAYQDEYDYLKNETDLEIGVLDTKFNALGNVICANDKGAIVSPALSKENCKIISDVMGVEVLPKKIAGSHLAGVSLTSKQYRCCNSSRSRRKRYGNYCRCIRRESRKIINKWRSTICLIRNFSK